VATRDTCAWPTLRTSRFCREPIYGYHASSGRPGPHRTSAPGRQPRLSGAALLRRRTRPRGLAQTHRPDRSYLYCPAWHGTRHALPAPAACRDETRQLPARRSGTWVDLRAESPTFLRWHAEELSPPTMATAMLVIPEGFAHGFQVLTDDANCSTCTDSHFYAPDAEGGVRHATRRWASLALTHHRAIAARCGIPLNRASPDSSS
jgi:dTDP-4-dehydrorhamnose 3,5-epimerase